MLKTPLSDLAQHCPYFSITHITIIEKCDRFISSRSTFNSIKSRAGIFLHTPRHHVNLFWSHWTTSQHFILCHCKKAFNYVSHLSPAMSSTLKDRFQLMLIKRKTTFHIPRNLLSHEINIVASGHRLPIKNPTVKHECWKMFFETCKNSEHGGYSEATSGFMSLNEHNASYNMVEVRERRLNYNCCLFNNSLAFIKI